MCLYRVMCVEIKDKISFELVDTLNINNGLRYYVGIQKSAEELRLTISLSSMELVKTEA